MKTMLITGAGAGIGAATARRFAKAGWQLGLVDVASDAVENLNRELGGQHWTGTVDVTNASQVGKALADFEKFSGGQLHLLFNSAGVLRTGAFEEIEGAEHKRIIDINVTGTITVCQQAFPLLKATPGARVINMSSASALYGTPSFASYSASKFAIRGLTEALNLEWQKHDILVQDMMPPFVKTGMVADQAATAPIIERLGVNLTAEQIAEAVWKASHGKQVHNPVSFQFKSLMFTNKWLPTGVTRNLLGLLSRE